jgi:hypothetical protein
MSIEENKAIGRRFIEEVLSKHNLDVLDQFMAENIYDHDQFAGPPQGIEGQRQALGMLQNAFPDQEYTVDAVIGESESRDPEHPARNAQGRAYGDTTLRQVSCGLGH